MHDDDDDDNMLDICLDVHIYQDEEEVLSSDQDDASFSSMHCCAAKNQEVPSTPLARCSLQDFPPIKNRLPVLPDFISELTSTWNKLLSICVTTTTHDLDISSHVSSADQKTGTPGQPLQNEVHINIHN